MNNSEISVVIPSYNGEMFIADAIDSILMQTCPAAEIFVVDDGSTDRTESVVSAKSGNIRFIRQQHTGMPAAGRNRGIKETGGKYIAFLDQDDVWPKDTLQIHMENMIKYPELEISVGNIQKMVLTESSERKPEFKQLDLPENLYMLCSTLIKKTAFENVGFFDENMKHVGSDFDWMLRVREFRLPVIIDDRVTLIYRLHNNNHSKDHELMNRALIEVFKKSMDRRRAHGKKTLIPLPEFNLPGDKLNLP